MGRFLALVSTLGLLAAAGGCRSDPKDSSVQATLAQVEQAQSHLVNLRKAVEDVLAKKKGEADKLTAKDFADAEKQAEDLKTVGLKMQESRTKAERVRDEVTDKERKELAGRYADRLRTAIVELRTEKKALDDALHRAEEVNSAAVTPLKNRVRDAFGAFESLAKQR